MTLHIPVAVSVALRLYQPGACLSNLAMACTTQIPTSQMEVRCPVAVSKSMAIKSNVFITLRRLARSMP